MVTTGDVGLPASALRSRYPQVTPPLFNPKTSILIQKCHPYTGNLNRETSGDSKNAFLHCGDVLAQLAATHLCPCQHETTIVHMVHDGCFPTAACW